MVCWSSFSSKQTIIKKITLFIFYKNIFYKNIETEICEIVRIFDGLFLGYKKNSDQEVF